MRRYKKKFGKLHIISYMYIFHKIALFFSRCVKSENDDNVGKNWFDLHFGMCDL